MFRLTFKYYHKGAEQQAVKTAGTERELKELAQAAGQKYTKYYYWIERVYESNT